MSAGGTGRLLAGTILTPPVLSGAFRILNPNGEVSRSGYFFRMYLPDTGGLGVGEPTTGYTAALVNADLSETTWCAYAWPVNYQQSGNRTFFTNQGGDVIASENSAYSGTTAGPLPDAAFKVAGAITGSVAIGVVGADGKVWKQVN
jgi:hypothetical protein